LVRQLNKQAVLIDLDLRRPSVHRYFGFQPARGVSDFLLGRQPLTACLIHLGSERLVLMPQAGPVEASSELLASPRMAELVGELKARYPDATFIYDCPPLLTTDDPLVAMGHVDGCLLVVHEGKTRKAELLRAAELVGETRLLGTVLNNARWSSASNYYYG
jgi:Mrp family chromosome partitioning ATPase